MPALGGFPRGVGCQGLVVSVPALVPHRLAKGAVGSLKGRVPLLPSAWLGSLGWAGPRAHERPKLSSVGWVGGWTLTESSLYVHFFSS
jgi:hypothetical protein